MFCEVGFESRKEVLIVLSSVELLGAKDFLLLVGPCVFKISDVKQSFEIRRDVFEKGDDTVVGMLVSEDVENEAFCSNKRVSVHRKPFCHFRLKHLGKMMLDH